jgi:secondary thiamine-phosphate synthase enzyme
MSISVFQLSTAREGMYNITDQVSAAVAKSGVLDGLAVVHCPHTTAGITVNENADPDVVDDILVGLDAAFPDRAAFRHGEGNSPAHLKSSCLGVDQTVIIRDGRPLLGTWQGIYFCEFDGPRQRKYFVKIV